MGQPVSPSSTNVIVNPLVGVLFTAPSGITSRCMGAGLIPIRLAQVMPIVIPGACTAAAGSIYIGRGCNMEQRIFGDRRSNRGLPNGCNGSTSSPSSTNVIVTPPAGPVTALAGTASRCIGAGNDTYTPTASNAAGYSFTLTPLSTAGTISPVGGTVSWK